MASNKITEGVGKKIVEALKQQSDVEINPINSTKETEIVFDNTPSFESEPETAAKVEEQIINTIEEPSSSTFNFAHKADDNLTSFNDINTPAQEDLELPANVAVLRQLISKLPSGVSKHTGAQIIKQTMEALGISMTNVLQEAQQVQEALNQSARDCQSNILEYKKQINVLESQAQKYQKQFAAVNDIISLFIQTGA